jgi:hypothetical protein
MSLWNAIVEYADKAWDYLVGVEQFTDEGGDYSIGYEGGVMGFLDSAFDSSTGSSTILDSAGNLIRSGAKAYLKYQEEGEPTDKASKRKVADIGNAPSTAAAALAAARNPIGLRNPDIQAAIRATAGRTNFNPQLNEISRQYLTKRQGQLTLGVGSPSMQRVTPTSAAPVRTAAKEVELG